MRERSRCSGRGCLRGRRCVRERVCVREEGVCVKYFPTCLHQLCGGTCIIVKSIISHTEEASEVLHASNPH